MPSVIIAGDFAAGSMLTDTWGTLQVTAPGLSFKTVKLGNQVQSVELVTEQNKGAFLGAGGWATSPLPNQTLQSLAKIFSGSNQLQVCLACVLVDGRKFVAIADRKVYEKLYAEALKTQLSPQAASQPVVMPTQLATPQGPPPVSPSVPNQGKPKPQTSGATKGCLGCLGVLVLFGIIGSVFTPADKDTNSNDASVSLAPSEGDSAVPVVAPTTKPTPEPTESPKRKRLRLAQEKKLAREQQAKQTKEETQRKEEEYRAANPLELIKGTLDFQQQEFGGYVKGSIRNNTDETYKYVQVTIGLYDSQGNQVGSTLDNVNGLEPGKTWRFKALTMEDNADSCKIIDIDGSQ